jgi:lysine 2,3-aminomutase
MADTFAATMPSRLPLSRRTDKPALDWTSYKSQLLHSIRTLEDLREWIDVTPDEERAIHESEGRYRWSITPYYAALMDRRDPGCPVRQQAVPNPLELIPHLGSDVDPVGDRTYLKTRRVVHKYPDRSLLLVTEACPVYCRHCTRKYHTTDLSGTYFGEGDDPSYEEDFAYLRRTKAIRDVLLTGGDPLMLADAQLDRILGRLRAIEHIEILRIGTRFPVLLPQRITPALCQMLERYHPIYVNTHFNHPKEITPEAAEACDRLLRHGIPVQNQAVLLKGINDDLDTMKRLLAGLLKIRVLPYYLYHCDNVTGVSHFVTSIEAGRRLLRGLIGHTTGFSVPEYVITTRAGKIPLSEDHLRVEGGKVVLKSYSGAEAILDNPDLLA